VVVKYLLCVTQVSPLTGSSQSSEREGHASIKYSRGFQEVSAGTRNVVRNTEQSGKLKQALTKLHLGDTEEGWLIEC
jgi:hypothetical protein